MSDREELLRHIVDEAVVHEHVVLSSGKEAEYYIDMRRITLSGAAAPLVGRVMLDLVAGWDFRKEAKTHGLHKRIEGPGVAGRRVLVVEDTSTTGGSALTAVEALREAGATVVGVADIVDRSGRAVAEAMAESGLEYRFVYSAKDLGL